LAAMAGDAPVLEYYESGLVEELRATDFGDRS
jgi:hypothetical protein